MNSFQKYYRKDLSGVYRNFLGKEKGLKISDPLKVPHGKHSKIILDNIVGDLEDAQNYLENIKSNLAENSEILISYHNHLWQPILSFATLFGLRKNVSEQNWFDENDMDNVLFLSGYTKIVTLKRLLLPVDLGFVSEFINKIIANLPIINNLCLTLVTIARPVVTPLNKKEHSVSIIVPARNEEGNIRKIVSTMPKFGKNREIIFVEGHSKDDTWKAVKQESNKNPDVKAFKQKGKGKADAVWLGFNKAKGDILIIYDADRTVAPEDLVKFYKALKESPNSFANGSRLIYPLEKQAMRTLNKIGNKLFSMMFTWILGQRFKDTLCGTKAIFKKDFDYIHKHYKRYFDMDPFGDFALIFGSVRINLRVIEIPVRYKERVYGSTNIHRFRHGLMLMKMCIEAFKEFKLF